MKNLPVRTVVATLVLAVLGLVPAGAEATTAPAPTSALQTAAVPTAAGRDCIGRNNLDEVAAKFISRCKKGSINREFPDSHRPRTLGQIMGGRSADDKKAWKLLNDHEYDK
ncbi:MAG: hypothetical protein ACRDRH_23560 [Pseudonocardia sp.]